MADSNEYDELFSSQSTSLNEYDKLFEQDGKAINSGLRNSMQQASKKNPDQQAKILDLSKNTNLPADTVERNQAEVEAKNKFEGNDYDKMLRDNPHLSKQLSDPAFSGVASDDLGPLSDIEHGFFGRSIRNIAASTDTLGANLVGSIGDIQNEIFSTTGSIGFDGESFSYITPDEFRERSLEGNIFNPFKAIQEFGLEEAEAFRVEQGFTQKDVIESFNSGEVLETIGNAVGFGIETFTASSPYMALAVLNMPAFIASFATEKGGIRAENDKRAGKATLQDTIEALPLTVASALLERYGGMNIINAGKSTVKKEVLEEFGKGVIKQVLARTSKELLKAGSKEGGTELLQEGFFEYGAETFGTKKEIDVNEMIKRGLWGALAGFTGGGVMGGTISAVREVDRAVQNQTQFNEIIQASNNSALRERSPDQFKSYIRNLAEKSDMDGVFIPVDKFNELYQSDEMNAEQVAEQLGILDQYREASITSTDMMIPIDVYATEIAPDNHSKLENDIKVRIDDRSLADAEAQAEEAEQRARTDIERAVSEIEAGSNEETAYNQVLEDIRGQLSSLPQFTGQGGTVDVQATQMASVFHTLARRSNEGKPESEHVTAVDLFRQFPVKIQGDIPSILQLSESRVDELDLMLDALSEGNIPSDKDVYGPSLIEFLREQGIADEGGELAARDTDGTLEPFQRKLINPEGLTLDDAALFATEAGYFPALGADGRADINQLLGGIDTEMHGSPVFSEANLDPALLGRKQALDELSDLLEQAGLDPEVVDREQLKRIIKGEENVDGTSFDQSAYHGTPHKFDKFSLEAMGTGEGAQAYGWGMYFAGRKSVAEYYRDELSNQGGERLQVIIDGELDSIIEPMDRTIRDEAFFQIKSSPDVSPESAIEMIHGYIDGGGESKFWNPTLKELEKLKGRDIEFRDPEGNLYEVDIPEDNELLDWDKPLNESPVFDKIKQAEGDEFGGYMTAQEYMNTFDSHKEFANRMNEAGIHGLRYLDGMSRNRPFKEVVKEFRSELPDNADIDDVTDLIGTGTFSDKNDALLKALAADDWLGFDYPSQAIGAALGKDLQNFDPSTELRRAVSDALDGGTHNYVIWDEGVVTIQSVNDEQIKADIALDESGKPKTLFQKTRDIFQRNNVDNGATSDLDLNQQFKELYQRIQGDEQTSETTRQETVARLERWWDSIGLHSQGSDRLVEQEWAEPTRYEEEFSSNPFGKTKQNGEAEQEKLIDTAREQGFFFDDEHSIFDAISAYENKGGAEHDAYIVGENTDDKLVVRSTTQSAQGDFGNTSAHSPVDYLKRLNNYNTIFPNLAIEFLGVSQHEDGTAEMWTAQPFVNASEFESQADLDAAMRANGWFQAGGSNKYENKTTGAIIDDVHKGNVLVGEDGQLYPIDVIVEKMPQGVELFQSDGYKIDHTAPVKEGANTADDASGIYPGDVYDPSVAGRYYGHGGDSASMDNDTAVILSNLAGDPDAKVTIYRAVPIGVDTINPGDWVTINKDYAELHGDSWVDDGNYDVVEMEVTASEIATDGNSIHEWGYSPSSESSQANFDEWFGDSKVVDDNGEPLVVYHGTGEQFDAFDPDMSIGGLHWFTNDKSKIEAGEVGAQGKGHIVEAYLSLQNPAGWSEYDKLSIDELIGRGYDGLALPDSDGQVTYVAFNPEQIKSVDNSGAFDAADPNIFNQDLASSGKRGSIILPNGIGEGAPSIIKIGQSADLSTFLHESGHLYLEMLGSLSSQPDAPQGLKDDMAAVLEWLEVDSFDDIKTEHHEKWAETYEQYLMEGKAPSLKLANAFEKFSAWLKFIYTQVQKLGLPNADLTPEIRNVMDRMLASDEEIEEAHQRNAINPDLLNTDLLDDKEKEQYIKVWREAKESDEAKLRNRVMSEITRQRKKWWKEEQAKMREQVENEVNAQPVYQAMHFLQHKELLTGTLPEGVEPERLSRDVLVEQWGKEVLKRLPRPYVYQAKGGVHPDVIASQFGFNSGDLLIDELMNAKPRKAVIEAETEQRMLETYGDMLNDGSITQEADAAIHNEARAKVIELEMKVLAKGEGKIVAGDKPRQVIKQAARDAISKKQLRDIRPNGYLQAEVKAAKESATAAAKGDIDNAQLAKRRQLLNHYLYREALNAQQEIGDRGLRYLSKFQKKKVRQNVGKAGRDYLEQIDGLLERYSLQKSATLKAIDKRTTLNDWIAQKEAEGIGIDLPNWLIHQASQRHYKDATVEEMRGLIESIKHIEHKAKRFLQIEIDGKKMEFADFRMDALNSLEENNKDAPKRDVETELASERKKSTLRAFAAELRKIPSLVRQLDGFKDGGVMWEAMIKPINAAADAEVEMHEEAMTEVMGLFDRYRKENLFKKEFETDTASFGKLSKQGILTLALNWGNLDGRQRIRDGYGVGDGQMEKIFSDHMTAKDWEFVQGVWDFINVYWEPTVALDKRTKGIAPPKVEAEKIIINGEVVAVGGYYPLKYSRDLNSQAYEHTLEEQAKRTLVGRSSAAGTQQGRTEARVEGVKLKVALDFGVLFNHVNESIHDLTHREATQTVHKIINDKAMTESLTRKLGAEQYREMQQWLVRVAAGDVAPAKGIEQLLSHIRAGAAISAMSYKISTAAIQFLGATQSAVRIGPKWLGYGAKELLSNPNQVLSDVQEKSTFMRNRAKTMNREINEIRNKLEVGKGIRKGIQSATGHDVHDSYFLFIVKTQQMVDTPTWLGAYAKAQSEGSTDAQSISLADQAVIDSQGGGQIKDLAGVQTGSPLKKLFTVFYSYFSTTYQLTLESAGRTDFKKPASVALLAVDMALLYTIPALLGDILLGYGPDDDDPEEIAKWVVGNQLNYLGGTVPFVREAVGAATSVFDYSGPAGLRLFGEFSKAGKQVAQGEIDAALLKSLNNVGGIMFHYPASQINVTAEGMINYYNGELKNPAGVVLSGYAKER